MFHAFSENECDLFPKGQSQATANVTSCTTKGPPSPRALSHRCLSHGIPQGTASAPRHYYPRPLSPSQLPRPHVCGAVQYGVAWGGVLAAAAQPPPLACTLLTPVTACRLPLPKPRCAAPYPPPPPHSLPPISQISHCRCADPRFFAVSCNCLL